MTNKITYERVVAVADRLVAERGPDYRYANSYGTDNCVYGNHKGEPQCIVGHILYELAPDVFAKVHRGETFDELTREGEIQPGNSHVIGRYTDELLERFERGAIRFMAEAQSSQDHGGTWKNSVKAAKDYVAKEYAK